jgi:glycosyltransferase involved in cell wall biosynthesis
MKKKVTILFSGAHLAYSPTVIGLYDLLSEHFDVGIVAESPEAFDFERLTNRNVVYREKLTDKNRLRFYRRLYDLRSLFDKEIAALKQMNFDTDVIYDFTQVRKTLAAESPDFIVAVDFQNLLYTQVLEKGVEFLSLEIVPNDKFYDHCDFKNVNSVVIQTKERYEHLFEDEKLKTFFIQNAPVFTEAENRVRRNGLVYCGTAWNPFGFYHCLEFLRTFPEYTLNVKGALPSEDKAKMQTDYQDLTTNGRLIFDREYLDDAAVVDYLRQFKAGFCFYNFELEWINNFNYYSAPSGKMFKYLAAGVPVVGQDILGLNPVEEFDCGVLIKDLEPRTIKKAVEKIEENFSYYSKNCLKAAAHYSFDKTSKPFVDYLQAK